ncbi:hypothetical protein DHW03_16675 [Pedobacter yonginense]|uniref:Methyltransferase type 11 domain-containing protein n=1 Tax=Pedobacter yonginense TaxID=651869 RepID=A0A317EJB7_9SPHI|nr:methyltransferase domain-containing protein [Pedobacter yonginense]PWS26415.1 hypothetical protein DHW03_16675 [Pedobacter yonginense]
MPKFNVNYIRNGIKNRSFKILKQIENLVGYELVRVEKYPYTKYKNIKLNNNLSLSQNHKNINPLKLHFGCGPRVLKNWINIDLAFEPFENYLQHYQHHFNEEVRGTIADFYAIDIITQGLALPDNCVDYIFHEDFFEHLNQRDQFVFLAETFRVMKKGAVQRINTPNISASMRDHSDFKKGKTGVYTQEWNQWHHYNVVSPTILKEMANLVGFSEIIFNNKNESIIKAHLPLEYRPNFEDRPASDSNVFADLIK